MFVFALFFLIGDMLVQQMVSLPSIWLLLTLIVLCVGSAYKLNRNRCLVYLPLAFFVGMLYTSWSAQQALSWTLPLEQENIPLQVVGDVISIPKILYGQAVFDLLIHNPDRIVKLVWHSHPNDLKVGDRWQLFVKLKRIHGLQNPGSFDYEAWALEHGLRATGSVVDNENNIYLAHYGSIHIMDQMRQLILKKLELSLPHSMTAHWLIVLAIGERSDILQDQWQVLRHTGTNHLMAIGGLHIGMVAAFMHWLVGWCWRRNTKLLMLLPTQEAGACFALLFGWLYAALSGFALPAQRACLMLTVYVVAVLSRRKLNPWHVWSIAMLAVLFVNPLSVLSDSFWLSFGTIALIIFGMSGRLSTNTIWWKWGRVQWVIGIGLLPLSLLLFQECSLTSFLANSIAIPWLGLFILPFCLVGTLLLFIIPPLGQFLLILADKSLSWLWMILSWMSQWHLATWSQAMPSGFIFIISIGGILILLSPAKFPARWLGIIWLLPIILYKPVLLAAGEAKVTLLDVGQGLSVVVQTRQHVLVFDAGPSSANVVAPYLHSQFIKKIDELVISHGDEDHIGGVKDVLQSVAVKNIHTSVPEKFPATIAQLCLAGQHWQWDGVEFRFLYPYPDTLHLGNDSSCVLRIDAGNDSVLIPGDIEKYAEIKLVERTADKLNVTTLIAPHHGSHTSGLPEFINAVYPRYVMYAVGYRNRYHFPHPDILDSYRAIHAEAFNSVDQGAIEWIMGTPITKINAFRQQNNHFWLKTINKTIV